MCRGYCHRRGECRDILHSHQVSALLSCHSSLHPPIDPPHELALLLIFKGLMEFIRPSSRSSSISQDNLHSLFVTLREYLFFGRCSCRVEALQILSVLSSVATLTLVAFLFFFHLGRIDFRLGASDVYSWKPCIVLGVCSFVVAPD